jgi:hypothetical protein
VVQVKARVDLHQWVAILEDRIAQRDAVIETQRALLDVVHVYIDALQVAARMEPDPDQLTLFEFGR